MASEKKLPKTMGAFLAGMAIWSHWKAEMEMSAYNLLTSSLQAYYNPSTESDIGLQRSCNYSRDCGVGVGSNTC
jgi:hypothetical protein